jgi:hypothetical protein
VTDDIAAFIAAHPPLPGMTAATMINTWEDLASLTDIQIIATDAPDTREHLKGHNAARRQVTAAVRWVQEHHGTEAADSFVAYLSNASSRPAP